MGWNGSGNFQRTHNFSADASAGIKILASRQDAEWANFETGLENCLTRTGENSPVNDLPMGGQKHTNVGAATSATHYPRADQLLRSFPIYCTFGGTAEHMSASAPITPLASLTAGFQVFLSCPSVNTTTSVTLGLTGAGTATVLRADGKGPARGQVKGLHHYMYDGANWIITNPSPVVGKIVLLGGAASAATGVTQGLSWGLSSAEGGFALTSASTVTVPGGIRYIRVDAVVQINATNTSASGTYHFDILEGPNQSDTLEMFGMAVSPAIRMAVIKTNQRQYQHIYAEASVNDTNVIRLVTYSSANITSPSSVGATYMTITAID